MRIAALQQETLGGTYTINIRISFSLRFTFFMIVSNPIMKRKM